MAESQDSNKGSGEVDKFLEDFKLLVPEELIKGDDFLDSLNECTDILKSIPSRAATLRKDPTQKKLLFPALVKQLTAIIKLTNEANQGPKERRNTIDLSQAERLQRELTFQLDRAKKMKAGRILKKQKKDEKTLE